MSNIKNYKKTILIVIYSVILCVSLLFNIYNLYIKNTYQYEVTYNTYKIKQKYTLEDEYKVELVNSDNQVLFMTVDENNYEDYNEGDEISINKYVLRDNNDNIIEIKIKEVD